MFDIDPQTYYRVLILEAERYERLGVEYIATFFRDRAKEYADEHM